MAKSTQLYLQTNCSADNSVNCSLFPIRSTLNRNNSKNDTLIRNKFCKYYCNEGKNIIKVQN